MTTEIKVLDHGYKVLDHGYVRYVDHMGTDARIVEAARVSYHSASKGEEADKKLLEYLYKNRHCYHPEMEVLTADGWKKWGKCSTSETFLIPDKIGNLKPENLKVKSWNVTREKMVTFKSQRMSFCVTEDHRMFFKDKHDSEFKIHRAGVMPKWGHFAPLNHSLRHVENPWFCDESKLVGFFLGDGSGASSGTITFHLKKQRKIDYLKAVCERLSISIRARKSTSCRGAHVLVIDVPAWFQDYVDHSLRSKKKKLNRTIGSLNQSQIYGLFDGLLASDGSLKHDRPQIEFSSSSKDLAELFQNCACMIGYDAHFCSSSKIHSVKAYKHGRTSLESRKQYFARKIHTGKVFCATSSNGLLMVRGSKNSFGFVCGNTSPFEMCKITFNIKMPIFVMRQFVRHRMQNLNEVSARYTQLPAEFYLPEKWRPQDTKNKQGSLLRGSAIQDEWDSPRTHTTTLGIQIEKSTQHDIFNEALAIQCDAAYALYQALMDKGVAREMARFVLPVNIYTEIYCCWDLKNLMHFFSLRDDPHAQWEHQEYGRAMKKIAAELFPWTLEAYEKFKWELK